MSNITTSFAPAPTDPHFSFFSVIACWRAIFLVAVHRLVGAVYVTIGHTKGETLLPLPPMDLPSADKASRDKERVHVLETAVVTWTKQIKNILKLDPEHVLKTGSHPGPLAGT